MTQTELLVDIIFSWFFLEVINPGIALGMYFVGIICSVGVYSGGINPDGLFPGTEKPIFIVVNPRTKNLGLLKF